MLNIYFVKIHFEYVKCNVWPNGRALHSLYQSSWVRIPDILKNSNYSKISEQKKTEKRGPGSGL